MSYARTFLISIGAFIILNIIFFLIGYGLLETLDAYFDSLEDNTSNILALLFGPIYDMMGPQLVWAAIIGATEPEPGEVVLIIGWIVAPLAAALLSGRFGENQKEQIAGWFLTALLTAIITAIWVAIELSDAGADADDVADYVALMIGTGVIIGIFYGFFSLIVPRES